MVNGSKQQPPTGSSSSDTNKYSPTLITISSVTPPTSENDNTLSVNKTPTKSSLLPSTTSITFSESIPSTPNLNSSNDSSPLKTPPNNALSRTSIDRSSDSIRKSIDRGNVGSVKKSLFSFGFGQNTKTMWNREITKHILLFLVPIITDRVDVVENKSMTNNIFQSAMNLLSINNGTTNSTRRTRRPSKIYGKGMIGMIDCVAVMRDVIHNLELVNKDFFFVVRRHFSPIFYADLLHLKFLWMTSEDTNRLILRDIRNFISELKHQSEHMKDKKPDRTISLAALKNTDYFHRQSISENSSQSNPTDYKGLFAKINHAWFLYRNIEIEKGKKKNPSRVRHNRSHSFNVTNSFDYPSSSNFGSGVLSPRTPSKNGSNVNNIITNTSTDFTDDTTDYSGLSDTTRDRALSNSSSNSNLLLLPHHDNFNLPSTPQHFSMNSIPTTPQRGGGANATPSRVSHRRTCSTNNTLDYETMYNTFRKSEEQIEDEEYLDNDKFSTDSQSRIIRVAIMGEKKSGKSMLSIKFSHRNYDEFFEHNPEDDLITIDGETYSIDIFDTPGQDVNDLLLDYNISNFDLFILLFDLTNSEQTLPYTQKIIDKILNRKHFLELSQIPIIICGSKLDIMDDIAEHIYIKEQVEDIIKNKFVYSSVPPVYVEVSSETGENITNKLLEKTIVQQYHKCNKFGKVARTIDWNSFVKYVFNFGETLHISRASNKEKCLVM